MLAIVVAFLAGFAAFSTQDVPPIDAQPPVTVSTPLRARVSAAVLAERLGPVVTARQQKAEQTTPTSAAVPFSAVSKDAPATEAPATDAPATEADSTATTTEPTTTTTSAPDTTAAPAATAAPATTAAPTTTTTTHTHPPATTTTTAPPPTTTTTAPPVAEPPADPPVEGGARDAEYWRSLVGVYFPAELVDEALSVISCESNGDPLALNPSSGASGLFQFIPSTWSWASDFAGWSGADPFDPEANVATAAWLVIDSLNGGHSDGAWGHWSCQP